MKECDCKHYDAELDCCKCFSDWTQPMPVLQPCICSPCEHYTRTPKERGADKTKIACLNCKHLMFSDMYGECKIQLRIVNPIDTCEYAEPKERGGGK